MGRTLVDQRQEMIDTDCTEPWIQSMPFPTCHQRRVSQMMSLDVMYFDGSSFVQEANQLELSPLSSSQLSLSLYFGMENGGERFVDQQ